MHKINKKHSFSIQTLFGLSAALLAGGAACNKKNDAAPSQPPQAASVAENRPAPAPPTEAKAAPEMLREGEYAKLEALVGTWSGKGSLELGGNTMATSSTFQCEVTRGGVALSCVHEAEIEGMGSMIENALIGIDPITNKLHWYNINTMGETHDHLGNWANDNRIEWSLEGEQEGQPMVETISMETSATSLSFHSETKVGGERAALFVGIMSK